jgi:hypothetical protein
MLLITLGWIIALAPDLGNQSTAFAYNKNQLKRKRITTAKSCLTVGLKNKGTMAGYFLPTLYRSSQTKSTSQA